MARAGIPSRGEAAGEGGLSAAGGAGNVNDLDRHCGGSEKLGVGLGETRWILWLPPNGRKAQWFFWKSEREKPAIGRFHKGSSPARRGSPD